MFQACEKSRGLYSGNYGSLFPYILQAEFGDYEPDQPRPLDFISQLTFAPNQNKEMEEKMLELHKSHRSEMQGHVVRITQGAFLRSI